MYCYVQLCVKLYPKLYPGGNRITPNGGFILRIWWNPDGQKGYRLDTKVLEAMFDNMRRLYRLRHEKLLFRLRSYCGSKRVKIWRFLSLQYFFNSHRNWQCIL